MSIYRDIFKVVTCLAVIGFAAAPAYAQQQPCSQQNSTNCMKTQNVDPNSNLQGGGPYNKDTFEPGASQVTPTNPQMNPQSKPSSGNSN